MKKKGIAEMGVLYMLVTIVSTLVSTGVLFGGGNLAGSGVITTSSVLVAYSQMPHVKRDFREKKAVREFDVDMDVAKAMSDAELLELIRDDKVTPEYLNYGNVYTAEKDTYLVSN